MTDNLNDVFANTGNDIPLTAGADDGINVEIVNSANNLRNTYVLYPENTLEKVLAVCQDGLGLASSEKQVSFELNGNTYSDPRLTVEKLGLVNGAKLLVHPNGKVA